MCCVPLLCPDGLDLRVNKLERCVATVDMSEDFDWTAYYNSPEYAKWYAQNVSSSSTTPSSAPTAPSSFDAELSAQMATQSSIYTPSGKHTEAGRRLLVQATSMQSKRTTVLKQGGGHTWEDPTLLEWDPEHFRLFVGDLGGEVTDKILTSAFEKYRPSKARVIKDKKTLKSKGFGFVSFPHAEDFMKAWKEMNGKYVGSRPVKLKKATTNVAPVTIGKRKERALKEDKKAVPALKRAK